HAADYSRTARGVLRVLALSRRADRTLVEFFPDLLFRSLRRRQFVRQWAAVALLFALGRRVELVVHEAPYRSLRGRTDPRGRIVRAMWRTLVTLPDATFVHTAWERQQLAEATGVDPDRIQVLRHGESFLRRADEDRERARAELGLRPGEFHFLSIGFLQPHKGFDRAIEALARLQGDHARLDVVGSMRVDSPEVEAHVEHLRRLARAIPGVTLHEGYVSDELFDRWIVACDAVVLPYREIWSSGVLERAKLYGRPAIVSDVGGLGDQADPSTRIVRDDDELCTAMAELAGVPRRPRYAAAGEAPLSHERAAEIVGRRAAALRERYEPGTSAPEPGRNDGAAALPPRLSLPVPPAGGGLRTRVKRAVHRLTGWELAPLVSRVNELRDYAAEHDHESSRARPVPEPQRREAPVIEESRSR
ncbi:MAG TPA: glycosyltransferase family 4 protein, partial [Candidatus Eisenbacteria bacterium]|nr:glycosyltransferase family 4 protein [Candidatus Eisenbacteria bacterium]